MEDKDLELEDQEVDETSESSDDSDENLNSDTEVKSSNKSNFKKMAQALKIERKEKEELKKRLASVEDYLLTHSDMEYKPKDESETNLRLFIVETPEAKEYKEEIKQALLDYP